MIRMAGRKRRATTRCALYAAPLRFHIAGDQHLGSTIQYGIDDWNDASWAVCVPAVSNLFPRRWYPPAPGRNSDPQIPSELGRISATASETRSPCMRCSIRRPVGIEPVEVNHRAPGYGIIEFDKPTRKITIANWARWEDPSKPGAKPVAGWPITIDQTANGMPSAWALEAVEVPADAVVQVVEDGSKEIVYTFRPSGTSFTPGVPREGTYTVRLLADNGRVMTNTFRQAGSQSLNRVSPF